MPEICGSKCLPPVAGLQTRTRRAYSASEQSIEDSENYGSTEISQTVAMDARRETSFEAHFERILPC
jgi:hypothetical protein